jgi:AraC-like DNA-binding protein
MPSCGISADAFVLPRGPKAPVVHTHDFVEMTYLVSGTMVNTIDDFPISLDPGELALIGLGSNHLLDFDDVVYYNLYLDLEKFPMDLLPVDLVDQLLPLLAPPADRSGTARLLQKLRFRRSDLVTQCFKELCREREEERPGWEDAVLHWGLLILVECGRSLKESWDVLRRGEVEERNTASWSAVDAVRRCLDNDFRTPLSLSALARLSGYEVHYLCSRFKAYTGKTITEYLNHRRIRQAMHLLKTTRRRVIDIALECGFEDPGYFSRQFKRHAGTSPLAYRKGM